MIVEVDHKQLNQIHACGAIIFNPSDYCPYSEECLSFRALARGDNGRKGVQSHLRKVHANIVFYLVPCNVFYIVIYIILLMNINYR